MQNFGLTNKEHYGMLWYFLEWSIWVLCGPPPIVHMNFPWVSEVVVKSRDFRETRKTKRKTCRLSLISSEMICSCLIALFLACFINCSHCAVSVAKPSAAQAKYLDYEIGASIHFNMQTFNRSMKAGKDFGIILLFEK